MPSTRPCFWSAQCRAARRCACRCRSSATPPCRRCGDLVHVPARILDAAVVDADHVLDARRPLPGPRAAGIVVAVIRGEQLVGDGELARVAHLVDEAARQRGLRAGGRVAFGELRRVGVLAEARHLAVAQVKTCTHSDAIGLPVLRLQHVGADHEHLVVGGVELARREVGKVLVLGHELEEFLNLRGPAARSERRKIGLPPDRLPVDVRARPASSVRDVAAPEGGVEILDMGDVRAVMGPSRWTGSPLRSAGREGFTTLVGNLVAKSDSTFTGDAVWGLAANPAHGAPAPDHRRVDMNQLHKFGVHLLRGHARGRICADRGA